MTDMSKYKVMRNDQLGRYLVATDALRKGSLIFTDIPFVIGPKPDSPPVCLGCHRQWNGSYICSVCKWPCCDQVCENKETHRNFECKIFSGASVIFQSVANLHKPCMQFECITPLRMLLAKEIDPNRWDTEVTVMEDHNEDRKNRTTWEMDQINIIKYLQGPCKLQERFSQDLIEKVCGILEVNAIEIPLYYGRNLRAIYPKVAIMSHSCVPNIVHIITRNEREQPFNSFIEVRAAKEIEENEKLELCYTQVLNCTVQRRAHLKLSKFFDCTCDRCKDPTEFGTNLSTMRCTKCDNGILMTLNVFDEGDTWKCSDCNYSTTNDVILRIVNLMEEEITKGDKFTVGQNPIERKEQELSWYYHILHPQHAVLINLKYALLQMYGNTPGYKYEDLSSKHLRRKIELCQEVLNVLDVISPGHSRIRGLVLHEMPIPMTIILNQDFVEGKIKIEEYYKRSTKITEILKEAATILIREDENSQNGIIGRIAMNTYKEMIQAINKKSLQKLKSHIFEIKI